MTNSQGDLKVAAPEQEIRLLCCKAKEHERCGWDGQISQNQNLMFVGMLPEM